MKLGSLSEKHLEKVIQKSHGTKSNETMIGPGIGNDFSRLGDMIVAEGVGETVQLAWYKAWGNFTCSLGNCLGVRMVSFVPQSSKESRVVGYAEELTKLAEVYHVQVLGGHTEVSADIAKSYFSVTLFGTAGDWKPQKAKIQAGDDIVMVGFAGACGTAQILREEEMQLQERFASTFLEQAKYPNLLRASDRILEILKLDETLAEGIWYLHDISCGGIYGALWQLGCWMNRGLLVENKFIPVKQSTIEICEFLDYNPYLMDGTGGMLLVSRHENRLAERLRTLGLEASQIGKITEEKEKLVRLGPDDVRTLAPVMGDEVKNKI